MAQKLATMILAVLLASVFGSGAFAQEAKKEAKKETKPAAAQEAKKEVKKDVKPVAAGDTKKDAKKPATMKFVSCGQPGCGFWAKSRSGKELRYLMKRHAKRYHKVELADKQLKEMVKKEGVK